jgi:hypothetical protein
MNEMPSASLRLPSGGNMSASTMIAYRPANVSTPPKDHA